MADSKANNRILAILKQLRGQEPPIVEEEEAEAADAAALAEDEARKLKKKKPVPGQPVDDGALDEGMLAVQPVPVTGGY